MSGKIARRLRKIAEKEFKRQKLKPGLFTFGKYNTTMLNAFKNFYKKHKTLYNQGNLKIIPHA